MFLFILANRDAVFTSQQVLYKLQDSELSVILEAQDPDHPNDTDKVQFSLEPVTDGVTVSSSGSLNWESTANMNTTINVRLVDGCDSSNIVQISLVVMECSCQNSGTCNLTNGRQPGSGQFQCQCVEGTVGQLCETDTIDSCAPNPCGHGACTDKPTGYSCDCGDGQEALNCSTTTDHPTTLNEDTTSTPSPTTKEPEEDTTTTHSPTTQQPEETTTTPSPTTQQPEETTTTTSPTTQQPKETTTTPLSTAQQPKETTTTHSPTTRQPEETTTTPSPTTQQPKETTTTPLSTAQQPKETTTTHSPTTQQPKETTTTPSPTTRQPEETTTTPSPTTQQPKETTTTPSPTTQRPKEDTTTTPSRTTQPPKETTTTPSRTTQQPKEDTATTATTGPLDNQWSDWSEWNACSRTCDYGLRTRRRECENVCDGPTEETEPCTTGSSCTSKEPSL